MTYILNTNGQGNPAPAIKFFTPTHNAGNGGPVPQSPIPLKKGTDEPFTTVKYSDLKYIHQYTYKWYISGSYPVII